MTIGHNYYIPWFKTLHCDFLLLTFSHISSEHSVEIWNDGGQYNPVSTETLISNLQPDECFQLNLIQQSSINLNLILWLKKLY